MQPSSITHSNRPDQTVGGTLLPMPSHLALPPELRTTPFPVVKLPLQANQEPKVSPCLTVIPPEFQARSFWSAEPSSPLPIIRLGGPGPLVRCHQSSHTSCYFSQTSPIWLSSINLQGHSVTATPISPFPIQCKLSSIKTIFEATHKSTNTPWFSQPAGNAVGLGGLWSPTNQHIWPSSQSQSHFLLRVSGFNKPSPACHFRQGPPHWHGDAFILATAEKYR